MEEVKTIDNSWIASIGTALAFLYAWVIRNTLGKNKHGEKLAANEEHNKSVDSEIRLMRSEFTGVKREVESMKLALIDWKETNNNVLIRVNKFLDQLE